jgi:hypothetical protein
MKGIKVVKRDSNRSQNRLLCKRQAGKGVPRTHSEWTSRLLKGRRGEAELKDSVLTFKTGKQ